MMFLFFLATELNKSVAEIMELTTFELAGWKVYYEDRVQQQKKQQRSKSR